MPKYNVAVPSDDEPEQYNEVVSSRPIADALKERDGWLRGSWSLNGVALRNFETNSPDNLVAQLNARRAETGVTAELEDGRLKLSHKSAAPILIEAGPGYQPPNKPGEKPEAPAKNTVLEDLGIEETHEQNEERRAQLANANGAVGQVGDGGAVRMDAPRSTGPWQTADEIEEANRAMMRNPNPIGGYAPHQPHETVPGTSTTGDQPVPVAPDSNERRVVIQPQNAAEQEAANKQRDEQSDDRAYEDRKRELEEAEEKRLKDESDARDREKQKLADLEAAREKEFEAERERAAQQQA